MDETTDRTGDAAAWRDLLASQGWQMLTAFAQKEWGAHSVVQRLESRRADGLYLERVCETTLAERAGVNRLLAFPHAALAQLARETEAAKVDRPVVPRRA